MVTKIVRSVSEWDELVNDNNLTEIHELYMKLWENEYDHLELHGIPPTTIERLTLICSDVHCVFTSSFYVKEIYCQGRMHDISKLTYDKVELAFMDSIEEYSEQKFNYDYLNQEKLITDLTISGASFKHGGILRARNLAFHQCMFKNGTIPEMDAVVNLRIEDYIIRPFGNEIIKYIRTLSLTNIPSTLESIFHLGNVTFSDDTRILIAFFRRNHELTITSGDRLSNETMKKFNKILNAQTITLRNLRKLPIEVQNNISSHVSDFIPLQPIGLNDGIKKRKRSGGGQTKKKCKSKNKNKSKKKVKSDK